MRKRIKKRLLVGLLALLLLLALPLRVLLRVLGAIQPAAAACVGAEGEVTAAPAAVAQAFIRWLTGLAARQPLAVHIRRAGEMDDVSRGVLEYLLAERPAGLTLLTEDGGALGDMSSGK